MSLVASVVAGSLRRVSGGPLPQRPGLAAAGDAALCGASVIGSPSHRASHRALLLDAAGTLLKPSEPAARVYKRFGSKYGVSVGEAEILSRYRAAFAERPVTGDAWAGSTLRYVGDARDFWYRVVARSTGCQSPRLGEELYLYYLKAEAWTVAPGAVAALNRLKDADVRRVVVSNFDTRLRPLLATLGLGPPLFDAVIVSAEVGAEKPNPRIFEAALEAVGVEPCEAVHVGDDRRNDIWGAREVGMDAWLWGSDVSSFDQLADMMLMGKEMPT